MPAPQHERRYHDGRDEMNLADFPISVLQRQQPVDEQGVKRDTATYEAGRYDPASRQRVRQRVVLETTSRHGLPTPADEHVILALLYVAKHDHDFTSPVVHFGPRQLFRIMGWAPNSRSYTRLRQVLRRLKALVIRYENAWWDMAGRSYEAEVATGIVAEYELARQTGGRKEGAKVPPSWVCWSPQFQKSLTNGNLKKLDLERLFALRLPTSQRMYRFLDKRFYQSSRVEMDLRDFACGHIGLADVDNIAELKRRLAPAITELEQIGFLARSEPEDRYVKVRPGEWRIRFQSASESSGRAELRKEPANVTPLPIEPKSDLEGTELVAAFYEAWGTPRLPPFSDRDLAQAAFVVDQHGLATARELIPCLVQVLRRSWPECKSFSGAVDKYLNEAVRWHTRGERLQQAASRTKAREQAQRQKQEAGDLERQRLLERWQSLGERVRKEIEQEVYRKWPEHRQRPGIVQTLCLSEMERVLGE